MIYLACGIALVTAIATLGVMIASGRKTAFEQQAEDDAQMAYLIEWETLRALERDLFPAE